MKVEEKWQETRKMCKHVARRRIERKAGGRGKCGLKNSKKRNTGPRLGTVLRFKGSAESLRELLGIKACLSFKECSDILDTCTAV